VIKRNIKNEIKSPPKHCLLITFEISDTHKQADDTHFIHNSRMNEMARRSNI